MKEDGFDRTRLVLLTHTLKHLMRQAIVNWLEYQGYVVINAKGIR